VVVGVEEVCQGRCPLVVRAVGPQAGPLVQEGAVEAFDLAACTTFAHGFLEAAYAPATRDVTLAVTVTDTCRRQGTEVVQVYAALPSAAAAEPRRLFGLAGCPHLVMDVHHAVDGDHPGPSARRRIARSAGSCRLR
jgi:hypothetical protein